MVESRSFPYWLKFVESEICLKEREREPSLLCSSDICQSLPFDLCASLLIAQIVGILVGEGRQRNTAI